MQRLELEGKDKQLRTLSGIQTIIVHKNDQILSALISSLEGAMKLKFASFYSSCDALSYGILFGRSQKKSDFGQKPWTIIRRFDRN